MTGVRDGELDKLGLLFERYHKILFAFFYRIHFDSAIAEDLVQNVFERMLKYRSAFKGQGVFKHWMFHIARNVSNDFFKKSKKMGQREDFSKVEEQPDEQNEIGNPDSREQHLSTLEIAISRLEPETGQLISMSKLEGMKYRDIGEVLGISEGNVKVKVFRALKELKTIYHDLVRAEDLG